MRALPILLAASLVLLAAAPNASAWLPVCKQWEVEGPYTTVHVEPDCDHEIWVEICPPMPIKCQRHDVLP